MAMGGGMGLGGREVSPLGPDRKLMWKFWPTKKDFFRPETLLFVLTKKITKSCPQNTTLQTFSIKEGGTGHATKLDEFWEKFQTAFEPSSSFLENYIAFFSENV